MALSDADKRKMFEFRLRMEREKALEQAPPEPDNRGYFQRVGDAVKNASTVRQTASPLDRLKGLGEAALSTASSVAAPVFGAADDLANFVPGLRDPNNPTADYATARDKYVYQPRGDVGKSLTNVLGTALQPVGDVLHGVGNTVGDTVQTVGNAAGGLVGQPDLVNDQDRKNISDITSDAAGFMLPKVARDAPEVASNMAKFAKGSPIVDSLLSYRGNLSKLADEQFTEAGGKNITIIDKGNNPRPKGESSEQAQRREIGKWVFDNQINEAPSADAKLQAVRELKDRAGQSIGQNDQRIANVMNSLGKPNVTYAGKDLVNTLKQTQDFAQTKAFSTMANSNLKNIYNRFIGQAQKSGQFTYDDLAQFKRVINDNANWTSGDDAANKAARKLWHIVDDAQDNLISKAQLNAGKNGKWLIDQLKEDKYNYSMAAQVEEGLEKQVKQQAGERPGDKIIRSYGNLLTLPKSNLGRAGAAAGAYIGGTTLPAPLNIPGAYAVGKAGATFGDYVRDRRLENSVTDSQYYAPGPR